MPVLDKKEILRRARDGETFALELGCGNQKIDPIAVGIDMLDFPCVDLVGDMFEVLAEFPAGSVERISTSHFMEHVVNGPLLMSELSRVLRQGGTLTVVVPHFSNPFYYSDPTHRSPFGLYTMAYYCEQSPFFAQRSQLRPRRTVGVEQSAAWVQVNPTTVCEPRHQARLAQLSTAACLRWNSTKNIYAGYFLATKFALKCARNKIIREKLRSNSLPQYQSADIIFLRYVKCHIFLFRIGS